MQRLVAIIFGGIVGLICGYLLGVTMSCFLTSGNLCGLFGAIFVSPVGSMLGVWLALKIYETRTD